MRTKKRETLPLPGSRWPKDWWGRKKHVNQMRNTHGLRNELNLFQKVALDGPLFSPRSRS